MKTKILLFLLFGLWSNTNAQTQIEGYIFESNNIGYISGVTLQLSSGNFSETITTDLEGKFTSTIPEGIDTFNLTTLHSLYAPVDSTILLSSDTSINYLKVELERKPAYIFDVLVQEKPVSKYIPIEGVSEAKIEIYNNTTNTEELIIESTDSPNFKFSFDQGNHYTLLIQKNGYRPKRLEAYVNLDGCILCFDGLNMVRRNAHDVLTKGNTMGTIIANIQMIPNTKVTVMKLNNIHYDYNKSDIRPDAALELDKAITVLKQNNISFVELESHTDSRGTDLYNRHLSQFRAESAIEYIIAHKGTEKGKIFPIGYGESKLVNKCKDGIKCNEFQHEANRRTVIKIHVKIPSEIYKESLKEIIIEEELIKSTVGTEFTAQ